jgi:GNAT superfamily N-acetyltransferase
MRPMDAADAPAVHAMMLDAFDDLSARRGRPRDAHPPAKAALVRLRHVVRTDPGGCWVTEDREGISGVAMATLREGVWGLSLLAVAPRAQSTGSGRALLARAVEHGAPHRAGYILSSDDPRAIRAYARAGFALHPSVEAQGIPRGVARPRAVRSGGRADAAATADIDRRTRGGARPQDIAAFLDAGLELLVHPGRGYAVTGQGRLRTLSALDEEAARDLLRAALAATPAHAGAQVEFIGTGQDWAVDVVLEAGLEVRPYGPLFVRGEPADLRHYLFSGAYL